MKPSLAAAGVMLVAIACLQDAVLPRSVAASPEVLPGTKPLTREGDFSAQMVEGIDKWLQRAIDASVARRAAFWKRDRASATAYNRSIEPNREHLRGVLGVIDKRVPVQMELVTTTVQSAKVAETDRFTAYAVRWPVLDGVHGEGLLLEPKGVPKARIIALPDADQTPSQIVGLMPGVAPECQFARRLAEAGAQVLVPVLISRSDEFSGNAKLETFTNQPHREWIYRQAFLMGRTVIGYEVQKVLAGVDWLESEGKRLRQSFAKIGVAGYGEGGLVALYAAALDTRINTTLVSGSFGSMQNTWEQPIYRNVFGLMREFGDAELAAMVAPRPLIVEQCPAPVVKGPPEVRKGRRGGAAPGVLSTPDVAVVKREIQRAGELSGHKPMLITANAFMQVQAMRAFGRELGITADAPVGPGRLKDMRAHFEPRYRQERQVKELESHTQNLLRVATYEREKTFWTQLKARDAKEWESERLKWKTNFWDEVMGRFPPASLPANAQSRKILETDKVTGYDVTLDVWDDVFAWGVLLLPKDLKPGERRPVVVTQHGLEGVPMDTINDDKTSRAYAPYKAFSMRLAEQGYIVFAPHNPYRGQDKFRTLQRKANLLGCHLFSFIFAQHERILDWLEEQPFVDAKRIAFYGLSYGGKSAMRIPAVCDRYCLSICSGDFNEWVWKNASIDWRSCYMYTGEYEIFEWNLGQTFNYAEMAALIAPRPFMVERGHSDGVGIDEWVNFEYAKVRRFYDKLGIGDRTEIEHFNGPHTINGQGTFEFLRKHLNWPGQ